MKMLVDNRLLIALSARLCAAGHDCRHVLDLGLDEADDIEIWNWALSENAVVISMDEDFAYLANRPGDRGRLVWVRLGNCRNHVLLETFDKLLDSITTAIDGGQRIVEIQ